MMHLLLVLVQIAAPAAHYTRARVVTPLAVGPNALEVDVPLLAGTRAHLADLRLFDQEGTEIPYLLVEPITRSDDWLTGSLLRILATKEQSGFELSLHAPKVVGRLCLTGLPTPFLKRYRLEGSSDRVRWVTLVNDGTLFDLPEESLSLLEVSFPAQELQYLRVTWDDRNSAVLSPPKAAFAQTVTTRDARSTPLVATATWERRESEPHRSRFRVHLPARNLPVAALELETGSGHLLRDARVTESRLIGSVMAPQELGRALLRRAERDALVAAELRIPVETPLGSDVDLVVEDGDNPPLDLVSVRAILRPQPWIYFEARSTAPLIARYGDESLAPRRYDLEAMRETLVASPAHASWGAETALAEVELSAPTLAQIVPPFGALVDASTFKHFRPIPGGSAGLTAIALDAAVLSGSRDLSDVRILASDGRQVPYLLESFDEPLSIRLNAPTRIVTRGASVDGRNRTHWGIMLPQPYLPSMQLVVTTTARVFVREVSVEAELPAPGPRSPPRTEIVARARWSHVDPTTAAPGLQLGIPRLDTTELRLVIDEGDNSELPVTSARVLLPARRLRFFRPEGAEGLRLAYGSDTLSAPEYDLGLDAGTLAAAPAFTAELQPEALVAAPARPLDGAHATFWGALIVAVLVLAVMLGRSLRP